MMRISPAINGKRTGVASSTPTGCDSAIRLRPFDKLRTFGKAMADREQRPYGRFL